jgi:hypothetical protein
MEYAIEYLKAEIDSLKSERKNLSQAQNRTQYAEMILSCKKAIKVLKENLK